MKGFFLVAIIAFAAWSHFTSTPPSPKNKPVIISSKPTIEPEEQFECDGRQYCSSMSSYEEAKYFTDNCPDTKMDGDGDGIPCERQFNR